MPPVVDFEAIRRGLSSGEFFLEYLPTVALDGGRCVGAEALARWRRPQGVLMPEDFIPAMENTPLSGLLTYWVLETAATELGAWLRENDGVHLSVNVPPEVLGRGGMAYAVTRAGLGDQVHKFVLEITERGVPDQLGINALVHASDMGVRIALDDVSLGGANFAVLARAGVEIIKIDCSHVAQIVAGGPPPAWLAGIAALVKTTKLEVVAEGVESEAEAAVLCGAGVQFAQGHYFSRPLPAADFLAFYRARAA